MKKNFFDKCSNTVVATITTGISPVGMAVTPDGCFAYVANSNFYELPGEYSVSVLNLKTNTSVTTIFDKSFVEPWRIVINASGTKAYVANVSGTNISIIDTATNEVTGIIDGFNGPLGMVITPNRHFAYVSNYGTMAQGTTVRIVDLRTNTIVGEPIQVGTAPVALAMTPDGAFVYCVNQGTNTISVIRTSTHSVVDTIPGFFGPFAIAITPNGRYAYVSNQGSYHLNPIGRTVSVIDLHSNTIITSIVVGLQPTGLAVTPDGRYVYVANYNTFFNGTVLAPGQGTVNIIDTATNEVIPPIIATAETAFYVAMAPNGSHAYVCNQIANVVSVIELPYC